MPQTPWYQWGPPAGSWPSEREPDEATAIGPAHLEPVGIFLGSSAMETLERAFTSSPDRAAAGFLLGYARQGPARPIIVVTAVVESPERRDAVEGPRFGAQALAAMERVWRAERPDEWVVGWFHGMPRRGVALSDFDRFTHHRLFPAGWQIALFVDTERDASLLYRPEGTVLVPCDYFYFFRQRPVARFGGRAPGQPPSEPPKAVLREASPASAGTPREDERVEGEAHAHPRQATGAVSPPQGDPVRIPGWKSGLALLLIAGYLLLPQAPGSIAWLKSRAEGRSERLAELNEALDRLVREQESLRQRSDSAPAAVNLPVAEERSESLAVAASLLTPPLEFEYTVRPGDTMWEISATYMGNPLAFRDLAQRNGIANPDLIFPGQRLRLPQETSPQGSAGLGTGL